MLGQRNKTGQFQAAHVTNGTQVSNYGTWELPQGVWLPSHFPTKNLKNGTQPKNMAELHTDKKSERKAKPQAKPRKSFPMVGQAGKGPSTHLGTNQVADFPRGMELISKPRTQFAS